MQYLDIEYDAILQTVRKRSVQKIWHLEGEKRVWEIECTREPNRIILLENKSK